MTSNEYLFRTRITGTEDIQAKLLRLKKLIEELAASGKAGTNVEEFAQKFDAGFAKAQARVQKLAQEIDTLRAALDKGSGFRLTKDLRELLGPTGLGPKQTGGQAVRDEVQAAIARKQDEARLELQRAMEQGERRLAAAKARDQRISELANASEARRLQLIKQLSSVAIGSERLQAAIQQRRLNLTQREAQLKASLLDADRAVRNSARAADRLQKREFAAEQKILSLKLQQVKAQNELNGLREQLVEKGATTGELAAAPGSAEERAQAELEIGALKEREVELGNQLLGLERQLAAAGDERADAQRAITELEEGGGAAITVQAIKERIVEVQDALNRLNDDPLRELAEVAGEDVIGNIEQLRDLLQEIGRVEPDDEARKEELQELDKEGRRLLDLFEQFPEAKISPTVSADDVLQSLPAFERTLLGAFQGMGRRFQATLQFAISGALLFQFQRFIREFAQAVLEVERSFADIETALEFDIEAPRGTALFEQEVSRVRRAVLQIADDFNVLPQEVNQAAFQMISRFKDFDAAMTATRAQMLATQIATIDQAEALRSLTAVAESYGTLLYDIEDATRRERLQAKIYTDVLDQAVVIQQEFGIAVEDTLEGAAGAAEVYTQLGIAQEQLLADAAALTRRTGQSGQVVQDRLQRFLSAIADPNTQEKILAISRSTEALDLTLRDFTTQPAVALEKLRQQFPALDRESKALAFRLGELLGGERQLRDALAFLRTGELSAQIMNSTADATGRAEERMAILLNTMQGSIDGVLTGFNILAQTLQDIGAFTPFGVILKGGDLLLRTVNLIAAGFGRMVELLNIIRLPAALKGGLGDLVTFLLAAVVAAESLKRVLAGLTLLTNVEGGLIAGFFGGTKIGETLKAQPVKGIGTAGTLGSVRIQSALLAAQAAGTSFGKTIKDFFINPVGTLKNSILRMYASFTRLLAALGIGTATTQALTAAQTAENAAKATGIIATYRSAGAMAAMGVAVRGLGALLLGVVRFAGPLIALALAASAISSVIGALVKGVRELLGLGAPDARSSTADRVAEIIAEGEAAGQAITQREAQIQALQEALDDQLKKGVRNVEGLGSLIGDAGNIFDAMIYNTVAGILPKVTVEDIGSDFEPAARDFRVSGLAKDILTLMAKDVEDEIAKYAKLVEESGGRGAEKLEEARETLKFLNDILAEYDPDAVDAVSIESKREAYAKIRLVLENQLQYLPDIFNELFTGITEDATGAGDMTAQAIQDRMAELQRKLQLGAISPEAAAEEYRKLQVLAAAVIEDSGSSDELIKKGQEAFDEALLGEVQAIESIKAAKLQRLALIEDTERRIQAEIKILKAHLDAIIAMGGRPEAEKQAEFEILQAETELARHRRDEAFRRLEFAVSRSKTYDEQIASLGQLKAAIVAEAFSSASFLQLLTGRFLSIDDLEKIAEITDRQAELRREKAVLSARLAVTMKASTLDNIAAIQAEIAALGAEIVALQGQADQLVILQKLQDLRAQVTRREMALAERRAAFFRLTAGVGNEIKAAQAEVRASLDRLATIEKQGGAGTQQAYEAELEVLRAKQRVADLLLRLSDVTRRLASDLTDSYEQALLDIQAAQEELAAAGGKLERRESRKKVKEAENRAQREFYDRQLSDLDFLFRTEKLSQAAYISALRTLQGGVNRTTRQGEEIWREIELLILGFNESVEEFAEQTAFNVPTEIRLPTLFEVRRALAADALAVDYQDNRQQNINIFVQDDIDVDRVVAALEDRFGANVDIDAARLTAGGAGITIGGFG